MPTHLLMCVDPLACVTCFEGPMDPEGTMTHQEALSVPNILLPKFCCTSTISQHHPRVGSLHELDDVPILRRSKQDHGAM